MEGRFLFTDTITKETFEVSCQLHEIHSIELTNKEFSRWAIGRILYRTELYSA
jgi:NOL1/NOP2/fmu family ribosome biogenesis protein